MIEAPKNYHSELAKLSHEKSPRTREHFLKMQRKSVLKRKQNKLSTDKDLRTARKDI